MLLQRKVQILVNLQELTQVEETVEAKGFLTVALSGGLTSKDLYSVLANEGNLFRAQVMKSYDCQAPENRSTFKVRDLHYSIL